jgi:hypothetical protein
MGAEVKRMPATCSYSWDTHGEKTTDGNIAIALLANALDNRFDLHRGRKPCMAVRQVIEYRAMK